MFAEPIKILKSLGLREDMIVADLGAGTGFYSIALGGLVPKGKVYAIEIQKDFLTTIKNKVIDEGLNNVECLWGNIEKLGGTQIKDKTVDRVIASNVLFQVENKEKFIEEIKRILKDGGEVLLIDWLEGISKLGPKTDVIISKNKAREMFERKGFIFEREVSVGDHHYGMILKV